jgi:hypothetical protein
MMGFVLENFGPIARADMELGDLTILVGPQAYVAPLRWPRGKDCSARLRRAPTSVKSPAHPLYKLAREYPAIKKTLVDHGYDPTRGAKDFLTDYRGEGRGRSGASPALSRSDRRHWPKPVMTTV